MPTCIALLRGVNLAGKKMIAMADLRALLADLGLKNGRTLLQSGNLLFESSRRPPDLERLFEREAEQRLALRTDFFVRSAAEWKAIVAANAFPREAKADPGHLLLHALKGAPDDRQVATLRRAIIGRERIEVDGRNAYIFYPDGAGRSKLTTAVLDRHLGARGTARNWNTVRKLEALVSS